MDKRFLFPGVLIIVATLAFLGWKIFKIGNLQTTKTLEIETSSIKPSEKKCPEGYILVPGNSAYKTSDFCVMKYDAKCSNPDPKCITAEGVYDNRILGCTCQGNLQVVSMALGAPITFIPEDDESNISAKNFCENAGAHLINNNEWMVVARNVEQVSSNWCNKDGTGCGNPPGTPGKILANGHNDSVPSKGLPAGDDNEACYGTTSDESNVCGNKSSQKRTLQLSNGQIIWDFAGNVWQWIDVTIARRDEPRTIIPGEGNLRWTWGEFQTMPYDAIYMPSNPEWNSANGVGRIYHFNSIGDTDTTLYTYIRAGNFRHGMDSGAFTIHMQPVPSKGGIDDIGFRCVTNPI